MIYKVLLGGIWMIHMFDRRDLFEYSSYTHWPGDQYDSDTWYLVYPYRRTAVDHVTGWHLYQVPRMICMI